MQPDFDNMDRVVLKIYMMAHSDDEQAFHTYLDRFASTPTEVYSGGAEKVEMLVKRKVAELRNNLQS